MTAATYDIGVRGHVGPNLLAWFDWLQVREVADGVTYLRGWFPDQSALQGVLVQLGELGLEVTSLQQVSQPA